MAEGWQEYLQGAKSPEAYGRCIREARPGFAALRDLIARLVDRLEPSEVVCLGAGALNDIPFRQFVRRGTVLHLVDWLPGIIEAGVQGSSMSEDAEGQLTCVFCELSEEQAKNFCTTFNRRQKNMPGVCENFRKTPGDHLACENFRKGDLPAVYREDITGGFASSFAREVTGEIAAAESWRSALRQAIKIARHPAPHQPLSIADKSADLVISSMVLSQFEFEPYEYFASRATTTHGRPAGKQAAKLDKGTYMLRDILLSRSIERHCQEIRRILRPDGRCFMAFEMHHRNDEADGWFLVRQMHDAIPALQKYFHFDFDQLQAPDHVVDLTDGNSRSLVYCYLLRPRIEGAPA
ncbi:MAG: hypothetical protein IID51_11700 [Proteobacteria bacterium]|nr:hypothetical protein [Pseudomonadota bacterium]